MRRVPQGALLPLPHVVGAVPGGVLLPRRRIGADAVPRGHALLPWVARAAGEPRGQEAGGGGGLRLTGAARRPGGLSDAVCGIGPGSPAVCGAAAIASACGVPSSLIGLPFSARVHTAHPMKKFTERTWPFYHLP